MLCMGHTIWGMTIGLYVTQLAQTATFVLQTTVGTNYFGHYYLTHLLLDKLIETQKEGGMARAVFMSSTFEQLGNIDWNDLE